MPSINASDSFLSARWPTKSAIFAAIIVIAIGAASIIGWHAHWSRLLQIVPGAAPMQYNTALCFVSIAAGITSLLNSRPRLSRWLSTLVVIWAALTLIEYLTGRNLGIDELLHKPYFESATAYPGRMAPLTASCFILLGIAVFSASMEKGDARLEGQAALLACVTAVIGIMALLGYGLGVDSAYGWGAYSRMAFNSAICFLLMGGTFLVRQLQKAAKQQHYLIGWAALVASGTLIAMVAVTATITFSLLKSSLGWRMHTYEVLLAADNFQSSIADAQRGIRGYLLTGGVESREECAAAVAASPERLKALFSLTRDNAAQQRRLMEVRTALEESLKACEAVAKADPRPAVIESTSTKADQEIDRLIDRPLSLLTEFVHEEQILLMRRSSTAEIDLHGTARLLAFVSVLAAGFFVGGAMLVRREIRRRREVQAELAKAQETVQTLSGLLPMCSHCKCIRDDQGYWNQLEVYIQQRSSAIFSHSLCEKCIREQYPQIADKVISQMSRENAKEASPAINRRS